MSIKTTENSSAEAIHVMMPQDANPSGNVFGGVILKYVDEIATLVAKRHCGKNVVTASFDRISFFYPVYIGNALILKASINYIGNTSMEVGVRIEAEDLKTRKIQHTGTAYVTIVAIDKNGKSTKVPQIKIKTSVQKRRWQEAQRRREERLKELKHYKK